ncbi:hypothetical protein M3Y99_00656000 [Aphelenchoides fujianensis]|nr:hypothetical protein M3Y99_00656000 [Aphelenchoides fujianensis]
MTSTTKRISPDIVQVEFSAKLSVGGQYGADVINLETPKGVRLSVHHCIPQAVAGYGQGQLKIHVLDFGAHSSVLMKVKYHLKLGGATYGKDGYCSPLVFTPKTDLHELLHSMSFNVFQGNTAVCQVLICFMKDPWEKAFKMPVQTPEVSAPDAALRSDEHAQMR